MDTVTPLNDQLDSVLGQLTATRQRADAERLVNEVGVLFRHLNTTEGRHISLALESEAFPFDQAQSALGLCFQRFASFARDVKGQLAELLNSRELDVLDEVAFLAERAPLATADSLSTIRTVSAA